MRVVDEEKVDNVSGYQGAATALSSSLMISVPRQASITCSASSATVYQPCAQRIPVFSTGISFRVNVLGYMILETYVAKPFQRPTKGHVWGVQIAPGW